MTIETFLAHPAVQRLGWSLLHFLWQGSLLALLLWLVRMLTPSSAARFRYAAASLIMLLMPASLIITLARGSGAPEPTVMTIAPAAVMRVPVSVTAPAVVRFAASDAPSAGIPGWVVCFWIAGVLLLSLRAAGGWMRAQKLKRRAIEANAELEAALLRLKQRLGVSRPVRFAMSALIEVPTVIGWLRPYVLLPVTALTGLSDQQLEAVLAHELAHILRDDYLVNLLQTGVETLLFYHPAVWWVGRQMRMEREHCCDDIAVAVCGNAVEYAGALAELEQMRARIPELAMAASGGDLLGRVRRLLGHAPSEDRASRSVGAIAAAVFVLVMTGAPAMRSVQAAPQAPPQPAAPQAPPRPVAPIAPIVPASIPPSPPQAPRPPLTVDLPSIPAGAISQLIAADQARQAALELRNLDVGNLVAEARPARTPEEREKTVSFLIQLFDDEKDLEMKRSILEYLAASDSPRAAAKIRAVAQSDPNLDVRRSAVEWIAGGPKAYDELVALYDKEKDLDMKRSILSWIAGSDDPRALDKLMSIVKSDPNIEIRRAALGWIAGR